MTDYRKQIEAIATEFTRRCAEDGKLIEAGFEAYKAILFRDCTPPTPERLQQIKMAYMAGAEHLFASMINMFDPGLEETEGDLRRMDLLHKEVQRWQAVLRNWIEPTKGSA